MNENYLPSPEFEELLSTMCDDELTPEEARRLEEIVSSSDDDCWYYLCYVHLHGTLHWDTAQHFPQQPLPEGEESLISEKQATVAADVPIDTGAVEPRNEAGGMSAVSSGSKPVVALPLEFDLPWEKPRPKVVIETSPPTPLPWYSINSPIGLPLISYTLGAIITLIAIGIGAVVHVTHNYEVAASQAATSEGDSGGGGGGGVSSALATAEKAKPKKEEAPVVGHISGMADCRWADPSLKPIAPRIRQGTKFALTSGLMEITYTTGAKVILQGPCTYEVESPHGGYLALGKLTARVASGEWPVASSKSQENHKSAIINHKSAISKSPNIQISKFVVRTPTAIITDLGTEFGVEVTETGESQAHVFQGQVEIRLADDNISSSAGKGPAAKGRVIIINANQSAVVKKDGKIQTIDITKAAGAGEEVAGAAAAGAFVRQMPRWVPIKVFNTGIGLKEGDEDPHWQIVARSDQPDFMPQPAVVSMLPMGMWCGNDPRNSQWISTGEGWQDLPNGVTFTFRTQFELLDALPKSAVLVVRFMADNHVNSIRLNGKELPVPNHEYNHPFTRFTKLTLREGFVRGPNILEIDVFNGVLEKDVNILSPMCFRAELEGWVLSWEKTSS